MATTYTTNFTFPLLESGSSGWDAVANGVYTDMDRIAWQNRHPVVTLDGNLVVSKTQGQLVHRYQ